MNRYRELLANNPLVAAPLADVTDYPFRRILREFTDGLIHTEMVSVNSLVNENAKTKKMIETVNDESPPIGVQILASDELVAAKSIQQIIDYAPQFIDINMGCPVRKVLKSNCGAALLNDPSRAARIVSAVKGETDLPVGVKMRLGVKEVTIDEVVEAVASAGAEAVTIHGRTAEQLYRGPADREKVLGIARRATLPVIVSGDVMSSRDVKEILEGGASGALIARGMMGRPWFLAEAKAALGDAPPPPAPDLVEIMLLHLNYVLDFYGEIGIRKFRRHLVEYVRGLPGAASLRQKLVTIRRAEELREAILSIKGIART